MLRQSSQRLSGGASLYWDLKLNVFLLQYFFIAAAISDLVSCR